MKYKDYDPKKQLVVNLSVSQPAFQPIIEAFAPNKNHTDLEKLNAIYAFVDNLLVGPKKESVCQKKCFHCCAQKVAVKPIEIENIKFNIGENSRSENGKYCTFLNTNLGICNIYKHRPLTCRTLLTFDNPKYCKTDETHHITTSEQIEIGIANVLSNGGSLGVYFAKCIDEVLQGDSLFLDEVFKP